MANILPTAAPPGAVAAAQMSPHMDKLVKTINSCRKGKPLDPKRIAENIQKIWKRLESEQSGKTLYLKGSKEGFFRSVVGTKEEPRVIMTHCARGNDSEIGRGSLKVTRFCVNLKTGEREVVAICRKPLDEDAAHIMQNRARQEVGVQATLEKVEGVAHLKMHHETDEQIFLVMEECTEGDLYEFTQKRILKAEERLDVALDLAEGLAGIHKKGVVHRDLRTVNILLTKEKDGRLRGKVCDFDFAHYLSEKDLCRMVHPSCSDCFSRKWADWRLKGRKIGGLVDVLTMRMDVDALAYLLFAIFENNHIPLPHVCENDERRTLDLIVKLLDPAKIDAQAKRLPEPYDRIFAALLKHEDMTAQDVADILREVKALPVEQRKNYSLPSRFLLPPSSEFRPLPGPSRAAMSKELATTKGFKKLGLTEEMLVHAPPPGVVWANPDTLIIFLKDGKDEEAWVINGKQGPGGIIFNLTYFQTRKASIRISVPVIEECDSFLQNCREEEDLDKRTSMNLSLLDSFTAGERFRGTLTGDSSLAGKMPDWRNPFRKPLVPEKPAAAAPAPTPAPAAAPAPVAPAPAPAPGPAAAPVAAAAQPYDRTSPMAMAVPLNLAAH